MSHFLLFFTWLGYYLLHTLLAAERVKRVVRDLTRGFYRAYRLLYNVFSIGAFGAILWWHFSIDAIWIFPETSFSWWMGIATGLAGAFVLTHSFFSINLRDFIGISQLSGKSDLIAHTGDKRLVRTGFYRWVRHPFYLGTLLIFFGVVLITARLDALVLLLATMVYLPVGIAMEERKLVKEFGSDYIKYRREVKAVIPFVI